MSNLKKILSLALAVVMVLSFGLSAAAGPFTDVKDGDDYEAAINLLFSLEVLKGYEDGSYKAAGAYTREEFSKVLYVLMTGKDDGGAMYLGASPFPDVDAGRWSAGYITWAVNAGIVNGREDGLFHPTDVVKYAEAAKMLIVAMGYSNTMYTYPYGFIDKASTLGLFEDLKNYSTFGDANRGTVAQMAYNALFAEAPRFGTYTSKEGDNTTTRTKTVIEGAFGVIRSDGSEDQPHKTLLGTSTNAYGEALYDAGQISLGGMVFKYAGDVNALIGEDVRVWYKPEKKSAEATALASGDQVILIERLANVKTYILNPREVDDDRTSNATGIVSFKENGVTRRLTLGDTDIYNWEGDAIDAVEPEMLIPGGDDAMDNIKDIYFKLIDQDGNGVVDRGYVYEPSYGKVSSVSSSSVSTTATVLSGSNDIKDDDGNTVIFLYDGAAKNDRVLVYQRQAVLGSSVDDVYDVVKAETVKDVKHNSRDGSSYFFDGVKYKLVSGSPELGERYDLWLNANGYIREIDKVSSDAAGNWILVNRVGDSVDDAERISSAWVTGYLADGSKKTFYIDLDEVDEDVLMDGALVLGVDDGADAGWARAVSGVALAEDRIFAYTLGDNGQIDSFKHAEAAKDISTVLSGTSSKYDKDTNRLSITAGGSGNGLLSGDTVIYNKYEGSKYAVLKLSDLPNFSTTNKITDAARDGSDIQVLLIESAAKIGATSDEYGLVIKAIKNSASGSKVNYTLKIAIDGKVENFTSKDVSNSNTAGENSGLNDADLKVGEGVVVGYAKVVRNAAGLVTEIAPLAYADAEDAEELASGTAWTHGAVANKSTSGRGLTLATVENYVATEGAKVAYGFEYVIDDLGFTLDEDCQVYTINIKPYEAVADGFPAFDDDDDDAEVEKIMHAGAGANVVFGTGKTVGVSSIGNIDKSDLPGTGWMVDLLIEADDDGPLVKAVFAYNSVGNGEDVTP
ncbi:MAG: S-layer homology domain-containing protein [Clostridiales bacterium]|nr:S-layer homology domain-containing protein [Clostridiales bacterium]